MAASEVVKGSKLELALLRRHASEDVFGVQLAASNAELMARAVEIVVRGLAAAAPPPPLVPPSRPPATTPKTRTNHAHDPHR